MESFFNRMQFHVLNWLSITCIYLSTVRNEVMRKPVFAYAKTKAQISFAVTAKLISTFVFATRIVQFLFFLNPKFPAASHLRFVLGMVGNPEDRFSRVAAQIMVFLLNLCCYESYDHKKLNAQYNMSCDARKPVFGVSDHVGHKPACTVTVAG